MPRKQAPRPAEQRAVDNARYRGRQATVGLARANVLVPSDRLPELRALTLAWRQEAKLLLESDRPSADQILQIHAVCRALGRAVPVKAFDTRGTAAQWLLAHEPDLGAIRPHIPTNRSAS